MTKEEFTEIMKVMQAAFPNQKNSDETVKLWKGVLSPLNFKSAKKALHDYILQPSAKFAPAIGEILDIYDRIEKRAREEKQQEQAQDWVEAAKKLFHEPLETSSMSEIAKKSVSLVRDVCDRKIKYLSPECNIRQDEIEKMAGVR